LVDALSVRRDYDLLAAIRLLPVQKMVIETIVFLAFVIAMGVAVVKVYEWRQDVLFGPYVGRRSERNRYTDQL
jgi:LPS O-antigen subunit length determinant protein (WzzB/FepE family)